VKALYALVFVLFSFAAPAQTLETWIAAYYLDDLDCFGGTTQQSTLPPQIIGIELLCAAMLNEADGVATTGPNGAEEFPIGAIQHSDENSTVKYSTGRDDKLALDDTIKQDAMPTQITATEPTTEKLGKPLSEADDVAIAVSNDAEDVSLGATQPSDEDSTVKYSTGSDTKLAVDDTSEQGAVPTQIIATKPTIETLGEAKLNEADDVATTGPNGAEDVPVGAIEASENDTTCREFLATNKDELRIIWAWLDGYYKDEQDPPVMNTLVDNLKKLNEYCAANPTIGLITATNKLFGK
jgi:acid stress chaperone HdeB